MNKNRIYLIVSCLISAIVLPIAIYIEKHYNALPCEFCWYERYIYFIIIIISLLSLMKKNKYIKHLTLFTWIIMFLVTFYHILIENNIVQSSCSSGMFSNTSLPTNSFIPCNIVNFYIFGLSLASYNMIISLCMILWYAITIFNKKEK